MKGLSITGLILGIVAAAAGVAAIVLSAVGLAKIQAAGILKCFLFVRRAYPGPSFLGKAFFPFPVKHSQQISRFHAKMCAEFWQRQNRLFP